MNYAEWEQTISNSIKADSLWKMKAYRLATLMGDLAWHDATKLAQDRRTFGVSDQLYRAVGSLGANLAEGYSMGTGKNRARYYEYALGSARESRDWYHKGRHILGTAVFEHRIQILAEIIKLLLTMIPDQRQSAIREERTRYLTTPEQNRDEATDSSNLLQNIPLP